MATRAVVVELDWPHSIARSSKPPIRRKDIGDISHRIRIIALLSQILLLWQQGSVGVKFFWQYSMAQPRKLPYRCKNLANISCRSRVIANFVPNFVAMATREGWRKLLLAAFDGPTPKTPLWTQRSRRCL